MGANAEFVRLSAPMAANLIKLVGATNQPIAAADEPRATSLHAANLGAAADGETHVVMGAGIIGLGIIQCIKERSNAKVIVVDLSDKRLAKAEELGADLTINARKCDVVDEILNATGSENLGVVDAVQGNVDAIYDCAGLSKNFQGTSVLSQALSIARVNGRVVIVAVFEKDANIDVNTIMRKGLQVLGSWAWTMEEFQEAAEMIRSGRINRKPLISHTFDLEHASEAYQTQLRAEEAIKVVLTP